MIITIIHKLQVKKSERIDNGATKFDFSVGFLIQYIVLIRLELIDFSPHFYLYDPIGKCKWENSTFTLSIIFSTLGSTTM